MTEIPRYRSEVRALRVLDVSPGGEVSFVEEGQAHQTGAPQWVRPGDYYVQYRTGTWLYQMKAVFEPEYTRVQPEG